MQNFKRVQQTCRTFRIPFLFLYRLYIRNNCFLSKWELHFLFRIAHCYLITLSYLIAVVRTVHLHQQWPSFSPLFAQLFQHCEKQNDNQEKDFKLFLHKNTTFCGDGTQLFYTRCDNNPDTFPITITKWRECWDFTVPNGQRTKGP